MTTAVLPAAASTAAAVQQDSTVHEKTCLQRITEWLDPERIESEELYASRLSFAAKAIAVFLSVISLGGVIATGVLFSHLIVPVAGGALALLACAAITSHLFQEKAEEIQSEAALAKAPSALIASIDAHPQSIQQTLLQMGIAWNQIPGVQHPNDILRVDLLRFRPLIAYYQFLQSEMEKFNRRSQENIQEGNRIAAETAAKPKPQEMSERVNDLVRVGAKRIQSAWDENTALTLKIDMAFIHALFRHPDYKGYMNDIGIEFNQGSLYLTNLANQIFIFKNRNLAPITVLELGQLRVAELGQRFAAAMA